MKDRYLFRGKCRKTGEWRYGWYRRNRYYLTTLIESESTGMGHEVIPETVGQFTGLLDKNGVRIFEGDVLKTFCIEGELIHCRVEYDIPKGRFLAVNDYEAFDVTAARFPDYTEIIGNIHDHPELLKEAL